MRRENRIGKLFTGLLAVGLMLAANSVRADWVFTGTQGDLGAKATFSLSGDTLSVTLKNTATVAPTTQANILHGLFFDTNSGVTLTPLTATGNVIEYVLQGQGQNKQWVGPSAYPSNDMTGEWGYKDGIAKAGYGSKGIGSAGYGLFSGAINGNSNLGGADGGILPTSGMDLSGSPQSLDGAPLLLDSLLVKFHVSGNLTSISNVSFQYGTSLSDAHVYGVPEPSSVVALLSMTLAGLAFWWRRAKRG